MSGIATAKWIELWPSTIWILCTKHEVYTTQAGRLVDDVRILNVELCEVTHFRMGGAIVKACICFCFVCYELRTACRLAIFSVKVLGPTTIGSLV